MRKTILQGHQICSVQKTAPENTKYSRNQTSLKMANFQRLEPMQRLQPLQNGRFGSKTRHPKNMRKPFQKNITVVLCKKPLQKTPNIRGMRQFSKSAILQRLEPVQRLQLLHNGQFGSKIKNTKNMRKTTLQEHYISSVQKNSPKNIKCSRNETILKIGHLRFQRL